MKCTKTRLTALLFSLSLITGCGGGGGGGDGSDDPAPVSTSNATGSADPISNPPDDPPPSNSPSEPATDVKVLALLSDGVRDQYSEPDLRIDHLIHIANNVLSQSGVSLGFSIAHLEYVAYPDGIGTASALDDLTFARHSAFTEVAALRDEHAADVVVLFRPYANDGHCGYAWVGGNRTNGDFSHPAEADYAYSVVATNCGDYVLMHELGHNLGLAHSRRESPKGGTFSYAVGHGMDDTFVTIMASPTEFNAPRIPRLSSPDVAQCQGLPCGVAHDEPSTGADAVRVLRHAKDQVAGYRG